MIATPLTKTIKTDPDEVQNRNGLDHQRVYDPISHKFLSQILTELKRSNTHLSIITEYEE